MSRRRDKTRLITVIDAHPMHRFLGATSLYQRLLLEVARDRSTDFWTKVMHRSQSSLTATARQYNNRKVVKLT